MSDKKMYYRVGYDEFATYDEAITDAKKEAADDYETHRVWKLVAEVSNPIPPTIVVTEVTAPV